ncbi:MAG TPA: ABC transporter permease [Pyrinomonadaceae bacterium]|jgi:putative ABC transport system permease protein|nr:ABC transporter permease [Pyrinomonadaceae bacterium]
MSSLLQDFRFGLRMLVKNPVFTLIAVVTLALGIGANTAIFSVVDAVLLRPLPYPEADRLVFLWSTFPSQGVQTSGSALPDYYTWRDQSHVFDGLAGFYNGDFNISSEGNAPELVQGAYVTSNLFQVLKVSPAFGRLFTSEEEQFGRNRVVLLSHGLWQRRFGAQRDIVGRGIKLAGETYTVAGVMPRGLPFFDNLPEVELWVPISFAPNDNMATRNNHFVNLIGRLKPGVMPSQAQSEVSAIAKSMEEKYSENKGLGASIVPMQEQIAGDSRNALLVLAGAVAFVLLVACVNVANLLLARASAREKELAVRASLGASRARIVRQVIIECLPLGLIGGLLGLLLAIWGIDLLSSLLPASLPRGNAISVNSRVLIFTFALASLTILIFGLLPALQASRSDVRESLNEGGRSGIGNRRQGRIRRLLVIAEVALALVLLASAGLMVRSFIKLRQVDVGFTAHNVLTMSVPLPQAKYPTPRTVDDPRDPPGLDFYEQLLRRVQSLPGVRAATAATILPLGAGESWGKFLSIEGRTETALDRVPLVRFALVSPDYFQTFGVAVRSGRPFANEDRGNSQPVAIINETLAKRFFPNENPIGKTIFMGPPENLRPPEERTAANRAERRTIVGVVSDVKGGSLNRPVSPLVYAPLSQYRREGWSNSLMLAVQTSAPPETLTAAIREQVRALDLDQPITSVRTMDQLLNRTLSEAKFSLLLFGLFAALALLLAAIGIYGVMATSVTQRTHEIGLRMALGAQKGDVLRLVVRQGMTAVVVGMVAGLAFAVALTRLMSSLLFGVKPTDPTTLALITILLGVVALLACYLPARRATKVDPLVALRYE